MAKGKFQAGKGGARPAARSDPYAVQDKPVSKRSNHLRKLWPILAAVAGVAVLVVGILILTKGGSRSSGQNSTPPATVALEGLTRAELEQRFKELDKIYDQDLTLKLSPETELGEPTEEPFILTLARTDSGVGLDLTKLKSDLDAGVGREAPEADSFLLDPRDYFKMDEDAIQSLLKEFAEKNGTEYEASSARLEEPAQEDLPKGEGEEAPGKILVIHTGTPGRGFTAQQLFDTVKTAYETALIAEKPEEVLNQELSYTLRLPELLDAEKLHEQFCTEAENASYDAAKNEIVEGKEGFGFDQEALAAALAEAEPGAVLRIPVKRILPEIDAEKLEANLFKDVIGEAHTKHTSNSNRTNNLRLACEAIDGTVVQPGEVFSFNQTVGERTAEKGYKEALAYVSGGQTKAELGGGVCQVATSIYYAVLLADLESVERAPHMFTVDYVPLGMDATVYWGYRDYKFRNTSPYPIKVEASVSDGKVHIVLHGTEWKDYTVELSYEVLEKEPWEVVEKEVAAGSGYYNGQTITSPYTGYKVQTYRTTKDRETGKVIETTKIALNHYDKRDKVVAKLTGGSTPQPTEPKPTEPKPTEPKPTDPAPTDPQPTDPAPTDPAPTDPAPTDPAPTDPEPTDPEPTDPEPTDPQPTDPESSEGEGGE